MVIISIYHTVVQKPHIIYILVLSLVCRHDYVPK